MRLRSRGQRCLAALIAALALVLVWTLAVCADELIIWEQTGGPLGAAVQVITVSPRDPKVLYVGTPGGLYRSSNGGDSWERLAGGELEQQDISIVVVNPREYDAIYAGGVDGLFRSTDAGTQWVRLGEGLSADAVHSLVVHPQQPILYAGTNESVFKSPDGGERWLPARRGLPEGDVWTLALHPIDPNVIYAGTDDGVFVSSDAGNRWFPTNHGLPSQARVHRLVIDAYDVNLMSAGTSMGSFCSRDGGISWSQTDSSGIDALAAGCVLDSSLLLSRSGRTSDSPPVGEQISRASLEQGRWEPVLSLAVSPRDARLLYKGTARGFYKSSDGGISWEASNVGLIGSEIRSLVDVPDTNGQLYAATSGGVYWTEDSGGTWQERSSGLPTEGLSILAIDPDNRERIYAGTQTGEIYVSGDGALSWELAHRLSIGEAHLTGLVACAGIAREATETALYAGTDSAGVWFSRDMGENWAPLNYGLPEMAVDAIRCAPGTREYLYIGVGKEVYRLPSERLTAETSGWERVTSQPLDGAVTDIAIDPKQPQRIVVSTEAGSIYGSEDDGGLWRNLTRDTLPGNLHAEFLFYFQRVEQPPFLCALTDGGSFCSKDHGATWVFSHAGDLRTAGVRSQAADDQSPGIVYAGTGKGGVYRGLSATQPQSPLSVFGAGAVLLVVAVMGLAGIARLMKGRSLARQSELEQNQATWDEVITDALFTHQQVTPQLLSRIPIGARDHALYRYVDAHRDQALAFDEERLRIEPARQPRVRQFVSNWSSLLERMDNLASAAPIAARLCEQLCDLLGFSPLTNRTFKSLAGCMVRASTIRLSLPARFPIIFMLKSSLDEEDVRDVRALMLALNATSFFSLLVVVCDESHRRERVQKLKELVHSGADDFIVLDYRDLYSLFLAVDAERQLMSIILGQVDLTVVSPYVVSGPVPENMFFGRDYELKAIMRTIRDRSFAIVGGRKIGKTSILNRVNQLVVQTGDFSAFYLDCHHVTNYREFFETIAIKCQVQVGSMESPDVLRRVVVRLRQKGGNGNTIVFLLDEVDSLLLFDLQQQSRLFRVFRALSQEGLCRFVFCGERQLAGALHDSSSPLFNFCSTLRLSYLLARDVRRIVQEPMTEMGVSFEEYEALPDDIIELSSCHPNLVQAICQMLIVRINEREDRIIRRDDLSEVRASDEFREFFLEVTWGDATTLERLITVLMVREPSFAVFEVREALAAQGLDLPRQRIESALEGLELFSILEKEGSRYSFATRSFVPIVSESNLAEGFLAGLVERLQVEEGQP